MLYALPAELEPRLLAVAIAPNRPLPRLHDRVVLDVLEVRRATHARPPQLGPAIARARLALEVDDEAALEQALLDLAVAAMVTLARVRASRTLAEAAGA